MQDGSTLNGNALFVLDFAAQLYLVADENRALYLVEANAAGLVQRTLTTIDRTRRVGELVFDHVAAELLPGSSDPEVCARVIDAGRILLAADTLGAAQTMLNRAVAYSKERVQFGRAIGSFQAVKHMCAKMAAELEPCRAMMWYAAHAFDHCRRSALDRLPRQGPCFEVGTFVARATTECTAASASPTISGCTSGSSASAPIGNCSADPIELAKLEAAGVKFDE